MADPVNNQNRTDLSCVSNFTETITAVDGLVTAGLERNFGLFTALGTDSREHLTLGAVSIAITLGFPCLTAFRTALGLVGIASGLEEFLVFSAMRKGSAAIHTRKVFILKSHWMTSSLRY